MAVHGPSTSHSHLSTTPLSSLGRVGPFYLDVGRFSRVRAGEFFYPTCIEKELAPAHPCKGKTATECRRRFMVAVT